MGNEIDKQFNNSQQDKSNDVLNEETQIVENGLNELIDNSKWTEEFKTDNDKLVPNKEDVEDVNASINDTSIGAETIRRAEKQIKEQNSARGKWFTISFFLINIFVLAGVLIYQYNAFGFTKLSDFLVEDGNFKYIIFAVITFFVIMILEMLRNYVLIKKSTNMHRPFLAYKSVAIRKYYDSIIPISTGGQTFELMYLRERGIRGGTAISIPFAKLIMNQIALISLAIILLSVSGWQIESSTILTPVLAIISLIIIFVVIAFIIFLSVSKVWAPRLILTILKFLQKCRLIKDYNITFKKIMRLVLEYQRSIKYYASSFKTLVISFISAYGVYVCKALIAFFIYSGFNGLNTAVFLDIFTKVIICELVVQLIPIPGGSGISELSFTTMFISLFDNGSIFWALLLWRILDYFAYLLQGALVLVYDFAIGNKRNQKMLKKFNLTDINDIELEKYTQTLTN